MKIPLKDVLLYMGVKREPDPDTLRLARKAAEKAEKIITPRQSVRIFDVTRTKEGYCAGGVTFTGKCAEKLFENCSRAALMTVTAGHALDAEINRLSVSDMKNAFALDAAGVAAVECVADEAEETVRLNTAIGEKLTMRFSPGYGDMPLSLSRAIASATDAQRRTGVTVTEGDMLVPSKSVTAVIGIVDAGKSNTYARK